MASSGFKRRNHGFTLQTVKQENTRRNCFTCCIAIVRHLRLPQSTFQDEQVLRLLLIGWTDPAGPLLLEPSAFPSLPDSKGLKTWEKNLVPKVPATCSRTHYSSRCRHDPDFIGYRKPKLALPRFSLNRSFQPCQILENLLSLEYCVRDKSQSSF